MTGAGLTTFVALLGSLGLVLASTPSSYSWVYTYPTGFSCDPLSIKQFGADPTGAKDVSGVLTSVNSISNFDAPSIIFITAGTYLVGKSISLSKPVSLSAGAVLKIASGVTVTFNSPVAAPSSSQIFSGPGAVEFGFGVQASVYVEWFGAKGNGATDDTAAINAALAAGDSSLNVMFQAKTYLTSGPLMVPSNAVVQAAPGAMVKGKSRLADAFVFQLPIAGGIYIGRQSLPALQNHRRAITFSDAGIIDVYSPSVSGCDEAVRVQSTRAKGAGRQISQVRVEVPKLDNVIKVVNFFDKNGGAVMQGSNFRFGTYTDSGSGTALISFQASGGGQAYWDSNDFHFDRVTPAASSSANKLVLLACDVSTTLYRQNLYITRLDPLPAGGRLTNANIQDCMMVVSASAALSAAQMALPVFRSGTVKSNNFNNFMLTAPAIAGLTASPSPNTRASFNRGLPLTSSLFTLALRANKPSRDPRTGKTPPDGKIWPAGEARRFYFYHGLAQNQQLIYVTMPKIGAACQPSGVAITGIFDNSATVPYEVEIVAVACKPLVVADVKSGKVNISFPVLVGTVGTD